MLILIHSKTTVLAFLVVVLLFLHPLAASGPASQNSLSLFLEFKTTLAATRAVLVEEPPAGMGLSLADPEHSGTVLRTEPFDYASGTIAREHLSKIAIRPEISDGTWEKIRYTMQVRIEPIGKNETRVTAEVIIEALKRNFTGKLEWVATPSNGNLEETFVLRLGRRLFGPQFSLDSRKKFWQQDPRYVPDPGTDTGNIPQPDRKRW